MTNHSRALEIANAWNGENYVGTDNQLLAQAYLALTAELETSKDFAKKWEELSVSEARKVSALTAELETTRRALAQYVIDHAALTAAADGMAQLWRLEPMYSLPVGHGPLIQYDLSGAKFYEGTRAYLVDKHYNLWLTDLDLVQSDVAKNDYIGWIKPENISTAYRKLKESK
jgi:hypothetical protein